MQIKARYSHLNGAEYLLVHRKQLWHEVQSVIERVDAFACRTQSFQGKDYAWEDSVLSHRHESSIQAGSSRTRME